MESNKCHVCGALATTHTVYYEKGEVVGVFCFQGHLEETTNALMKRDTDTKPE
jgi:hypothetical protein